MRKLPWHLVLPGSVVLGHDGYEWSVLAVDRPDDGMPRGTVRVTMSREGRGEVTGHPPAGHLMDVISEPPKPPEDPFSDRAMTRDAIGVLKNALGATVLDCGWCAGDTTSECFCDANCGAPQCVNF